MTQSVDDLLSQLRPVTAPEAVSPPPESNWWLIGLIVIVATIALWWLIRWSRRSVAAASPTDKALAALGRLSAEPSASAMATLDQLSRQWLGCMHHVDGDHQTSRELLVQLPHSVRDDWSAIFAQLEPGRFSQRPLTATLWAALINEVRSRIQPSNINFSGPVAR